MQDVSTVLQEAQALVRKGWCRGAMARDSVGDAVPYLSDEAVAFCVVGALEKVLLGVDKDSSPGQPSLYMRLRSQAVRALTSVTGLSPAAFNDTHGRTQKEILQLFSQALEIVDCEAQQVWPPCTSI
jgi:hypothetical protein